MKKTASRLLCEALIAYSLIITAAWAGPLEDANAAYDRGDYATALPLFRSLAEQGDARAETNLGVMYSKGQGVAQDYAAAAKWYRKAADQEYALGQNDLGGLYEAGHGVKKDYAEIGLSYGKALIGGFAVPPCCLGIVLLHPVAGLV
jgi:uncharacterized protein